MNKEDYPSDSDASDADFRPDEEEPDTGSELESNDEEPEEPSADKSTTRKGSKKRKQKSNTVSRKRVKGVDKLDAKASQSDEEKDKEELDEEEEKRRTDALWADFLGGGSSSNSSPQKGKTTTTKVAEVKKSVPEVKSTPSAKAAPENKRPTVAQLFEFAGEQIVLTEDNNGKVNEASSAVLKPSIPKTVTPRASGGLGSVLSQISKKTQLSTLEKTKLDWNSFKRSQGIEEELQTHNKGKDGFLERRDFLERTDYRQFEIEKTLRQTKRSNR
ncbi:craniofacial development protein 1 [Anopheles maculipalpis]|uniref:craniofacial development protein 1 n=1 Tax=Anopheles maculipalpis TaxID=1496333 RepID=UPI00215900D7|nr:craniofacial development protein 1 [Anopheles maculipalpis]